MDALKKINGNEYLTLVSTYENTLESSWQLRFEVLCYFMCLVLLVPNIRLNNLTFMFLTRSGTHILE